MTEAFILVLYDPNATHVLDEIKRIPEVMDVYPINGIYDLIARIQTDYLRDLTNVVNYSIGRIVGVKSTLTMIVI